MSGPMSNDARFQHAATDPVFKKAKRTKKIKIDSRFAGALTDERFGQARAPVDKYGRKQAATSQQAELAPFYEVEEDGAPTPLKASEESRLKKLQAMARGDVDGVDSDDSSDDEDDEEPVEEEAAWDEGLPQTHDPAEDGCETVRIAVTDQEWGHVRASDLLVILQSLCPVGGRVESVDVFASDFGAQQMDDEAKFGPEGIFKHDGDEGDDDDAGEEDDDGEEAEDGGDDEEGDDEEVDEGEGDEDEEGDESEDDGSDGEGNFAGGGPPPKQYKEKDDGFDAERLRRYELSKLRRYYAVVTFDSVRTASAAYASGDGIEFESSSTPLELSFIPDETDFTGKPLRDAAVHADYDAAAYEPPAAFCCTARQNTKVKCTWDEDDADVRSAAFAKVHEEAKGPSKGDRRKKQKVEEDDIDASLLMADSDDDAADAAAAKIKAKKLRAALGLDDDDDDAPATKSKAAHADFDDDFFTGADDDDAVFTTLDGPAAAEETPFEKRQRKHTEKAAAKRRSKKDGEEGEEGSAPADATKKKKYVKSTEDVEAQELDGRDYDAQKLAKLEKLRGKKLSGKRKRERDALQAAVDAGGFAFDSGDSRFGALVGGDDRFGVDPAATEFRATANMRDLLAEQSRRRRTARRDDDRPAAQGDAAEEAPASIADLARSVSAKLKRAQR